MPKPKCFTGTYPFQWCFCGKVSEAHGGPWSMRGRRLKTWGFNTSVFCELFERFVFISMWNGNKFQILKDVTKLNCYSLPAVIIMHKDKGIELRCTSSFNSAFPNFWVFFFFLTKGKEVIFIIWKLFWFHWTQLQKKLSWVSNIVTKAKDN